MENDFLTVNQQEQVKILAGQQDASRVCHTCGSSDLSKTGSKDEWGYNLYRCGGCGDLCEFWDMN